MGFLRWCLQESNQGHTDFQSVALPTELRHLWLLSVEHFYLLIAGANIEPFFIYPKQFFKKIYYYLCFSKKSRMILTIDVGNTRIKSAVFEQNTVLETAVFLKETLKESIEKIFKKFSNIELLVLSSVGKIDETELKFLFDRVKIYVIDRDQQFPFQNNYGTPKTLGIDRMVLVAGAVLKFPAQNRLIVDAGTCVTYDFVDQNDVYHGGAISPGTRLRYEAMHNYTAKLPLLKLEDPSGVVGNSTQQSIHSGVINGLTFEIDGYIDSLKVKNENFIIILTGGDANFLAKRLKNTIFANSNFLLESLNSLYQYQINND